MNLHLNTAARVAALVVVGTLVIAQATPSNAATTAKTASAKTEKAPTVPTPPAAFQVKGFRVLGHQLEARTGLHIWTVQHVTSGTKAIIYSSPQNEVFFTGPMWDGTTGSNVSDAFYSSPLMADATVQAPQSPRPQPAAKPGVVPGSIKRLSELTGIKDGGNAPIEKTLFIFFDPRCPYCKQLYEITRGQSGLKGRAIVWLPVTVLGQKDRGNAIVADILQREKRAEGLQIAFSGLSNAKTQPNPKTLAAIQENESIFWAAFQANPGAGQPAVPVAFFMDKTGHPQMVPNPASHLSKIFQEMN